MKLILDALLFVLFMATSGSLVQATTYATPDCTDVSCPSLKRCNRRIRQGQPFAKVTPSGRCCPICVSTSPPPRVCTFLCIRLQCQDNEIEYKAPSECCAKCINRGPVGPGSAGVPPVVIPDPPDCSAVLCARPDCNDLVTPDGECCPVCADTTTNCDSVRCMNPDCGYGYESVVPTGQCCPVCQLKPGCQEVQCITTPCNPVCDDNKCDLVRCRNPSCGYGYEPVVPSGECCPVCQLKKNCHQVYCITTPCYSPVCDYP